MTTDCASWQAIPQPEVTPAVSAEAQRILHEGQPYGWYEDETLPPDPTLYRFTSEQHPAEPSIPYPHPGVTVTRCARKGSPLLAAAQQSPWLAAGAILAAAGVVAFAVVKW